MQNGLQKVDLKILLPTHEVVAVTVCKSSTTPDVYNAVTEKISLDKETCQYFAIFEIVEYNFGKLYSTDLQKHKHHILRSTWSDLKTCWSASFKFFLRFFLIEFQQKGNYKCTRFRTTSTFRTTARHQRRA